MLRNLNSLVDCMVTPIAGEINFTRCRLYHITQIYFMLLITM